MLSSFLPVDVYMTEVVLSLTVSCVGFQEGGGGGGGGGGKKELHLCCPQNDFPKSAFSVALLPQRPYKLLETGIPGGPPRLPLHSS